MTLQASDHARAGPPDVSPSSQSPGVDFKEVSYVLPDGRVLLDRINLSLESGTTTAILGRSGSGKTTLLRMVNGLAMPSRGEVIVRGQSTTTCDLIALRRGIGYVIQESGLFPHLSIERNVGMVLELQGNGQDPRRTRVERLLGDVGLDAKMFAHRHPWQLSGGQRQRAGLARALAAEPDILLMDEPLGALDPITRWEMQEMLRGLLARMRKTVLLVTHDLNEALYLASRIVFLEAGKIVADLPAADVVGSDVPEVRKYVQALRHEHEQHTPKSVALGEDAQ